VVVSKGEHILGGHPITEIDVWNYYSGVKGDMLKELKGREIFIGIKKEGVLKKGEKPVYIRHPYDKKTDYIHINNGDDFEIYHSGRTLEYHITMPAMCPYYIVDFDATSFDQAKKVTAEVADKIKDLPEVKRVEIRYSGKRGFHVLGWLKKAIPIDRAREQLKDWLKAEFSDHKDVVVGESPSGSKGALGVSPMKLNGGQVALWSLRVTGLCCIEVPRAKLPGFRQEEATLDKVYKKLTGKNFLWGAEKKAAQRVIRAFLSKE
jgi:hypothetical protein